eukprot:6542365-Alexandrium_andersonii.AAC.1
MGSAASHASQRAPRRVCPAGARAWQHWHCPMRSLGPRRDRLRALRGSVSYTHLTLPTICSV